MRKLGALSLILWSTMKLELYDTLTRTRKPVWPEDGKVLRFYCCGPTVYGPAHIGNFRTFVVQDLFRRVVELGGMETFHVRNITDVDDKTIRESQAQGEIASGVYAILDGAVPSGLRGFETSRAS